MGAGRGAWWGALAACALAAATPGRAAAAAARREPGRRAGLWEEAGRRVREERSALTDVARRAMPAVVSITTQQPPSAQAVLKGGDPEPQRGIGSGFLIHPDGYILTSAHVVEGASEVLVTLLSPDGFPEEYIAEIVGSDARTDSALLKVDAPRPLPVLKLASADRVEVADWLVVIGNPFGLAHSVSVGVVSYKGRSDVTPNGRDGDFDYLQTDASINPGSSGGPVLDLQGEVVAIANAVNVSGQGIGFAIPIDIAKAVLPHLKAYGRVRRGWLGVSVQDFTPELAEALNIARTRGVVVSDVVDGGPGARAGLRVGDVIRRLDGQPVERAHAMRWKVAARGVGRSVLVEYEREGRLHKARTRLEELPPEPEPLPSPAAQPAAQQAPPPAPPPVAELGVTLEDLRTGEGEEAGLLGVVVRRVEAGGLLDAAGAVGGDVVLRLNDADVANREELLGALARLPPGAPVHLQVRREGRTVGLDFLKP